MRRTFALAGVLALFFASGFLYAQSPNASLTGRVTDSSRAVIVGARIAVISVSTNINYEGLTNGAGEYYVPNLPPGTYRIEAQETGFNMVIKPSVVLHVQEAVEINFELTVGSARESITVASGAPTVGLATSELGAVVDAQTIRELPLNGRSWTDLATLQAGVVPVETQNPYTAGSSRGNRGFGAQLSISGGRPQQNSYRLDGVSLNDYTNGGPGSAIGGTLGVDAIEEFSVLTTNYPAEYGRASAGIISAVTRAGANSFHGTAYEFLRNSALDAPNYFDPSRIPPFKRNQFGGAISGPLLRNRAVFFADYEGIRQSTGITNQATVPSLAARQGHLSTGDVTVDPSVAKYLTFWPLPNGPDLAPGDTAVYKFTAQQIVHEDFGTGRFDYKLSDQDSLFATYSGDDAPFSGPDNLNDVSLGSHTSRNTVAIEETHVFSSSMTNTARFGFYRESVHNNTTVQAINPAAADTSLAAVPGSSPAVVTVGGISAFSGGLQGSSPWVYTWNSFQGYDDISLTRGRHSLKTGVAVERMQSDLEAYSDVTGGFSFGSLQKFLTNQPARFIAAFPGQVTPRYLRQSLVAAYLQDDWHPAPNLTLNLGVRYEMTTVPTEVHGKLSTLWSLTDSQAHVGDPLFHNSRYLNFEPRVGLSWDPWGNGRTAIRSGFSVYDVLPLPYEFSLLETRSPPFYEGGTVSKLPPGSFYTGAFGLLTPDSLSETFIEQHPKRNYVLEWNLSLQQELSRYLIATVSYVGTHGVHQPLRIDDANIVQPVATIAGYVWPSPQGSGTVINPNFGEIRSMQWVGSSIYHALQLGLNQRLRNGFSLRTAYTWSRNIDTSSSAIGGDGSISSVSSLVNFDLRLNRGLSDFNINHSGVIAGTWQIPAPRSASGPLEWASKGWELTAIFKAHTGTPFTPTLGTDGDPLGLDSSDPWDYPSRLAGPGCKSLVNPGNVNHYIKTECFSLPAAPSQAFYSQYCDPSFAFPTCINLRGNAGRNILPGPGLINLDSSLIKNTRISGISDRFNVQFRAEVFNLTNRANFQVPTLPDNTDLYDSTGSPNSAAGLLTSTTTTSRQIQLGVKLIW
jgi:Carboxypeptidase regulatory-like domain/TonB dependent receptor/TonB-dependent Receptor Plug Domain